MQLFFLPSLYAKSQSSANPEGTKGETNLAPNSRWGCSKEEACLLGAGGLCYLGDRGGLEKMAELRGDWRLKACEGEADGGDARRGLLRSPL